VLDDDDVVTGDDDDSAEPDAGCDCEESIAGGRASGASGIGLFGLLVAVGWRRRRPVS